MPRPEAHGEHVAGGKALPGSALTAAHAGSTPPGRWANGTRATVPTATLKEQVLWIERFDTLDELRIRIRKFAVDFNEHWLLERHGYRTPRQARDALRQPAMT